MTIALVDMDGTLADFIHELQDQLKLLASPGEPELSMSSNDDEDPRWLKARKRLIKSRPGFWKNLKRIPSGFYLVDVLTKLGFQIHILTRGPANNSIAWSEKLEWVRQHMGDTPITVTLDKGLVYGKVLVDDFPEYALAWLKHRPRGKVIMPEMPWNMGFEHPQVIRLKQTTDGHTFDDISIERWREVLGSP